MLSATRSRLILLALWAILVLALLPVREVIPPDEPRFTHQAQEMKEDGDWAVPKIGGMPDANKPPMLFWTINLASLGVERVNEFTARIPSALAALLVLFLTARLGRRLFGSEAVGLGGAVLLLTSIEFFQKTQWVACDMLMMAGAFAALTCWREALFEDEGGHGTWRAGGGRLVLGWLAVAFAILSKGPVGLLWPLFWVICEAAVRRRFRPLLRLAHPAGIALCFLCVGGWLYAFGARAGGAALYEAVITQNLTRHLSAWNSVRPWHFYLARSPFDLLPWSLFLPLAMASVGLAWRERTPSRTGLAVRILACFALVGFLFFSSSSGKRGVYLLPGFPAVALLVAAAFLSAGRPGGPRRAWRTGALGGMVAVGLVVGLGGPVMAALGWPGRPDLATFLSGWETAAFAAGGLSLVVGALGALRLARQDRSEAALGAATGGAVVLLLAVGVAGGSAWSRYQGGREFGRQVAALVPATGRIAIERGKFELMLFYSGRKGTEIQPGVGFVEALGPGGCTHVILEDARHDALRDTAPLNTMRALLTARLGSTTLRLLGPAE